MDEREVREILGEIIESNDSLFDGHNYTKWKAYEEDITLDGLFSVEELEAIAWWMRNKKEGEN